VIVGAVSLALLFGLERFARKIPAALTVVVLDGRRLRKIRIEGPLVRHPSDNGPR